jgi:hypothetical protein
MKHLHFRHIIMACLALAITTQTFSQEFMSYNLEKPMIRQRFLNEAPNYPEVNPVVINTFRKNYSHSNDVRWTAVDNNYLATFTNDERMTRILFDKKGNVIYSITNGTVKNLPSDTRKMIRSIYYDFDITLVSEVHSLGKTAWIINMEDEKNIVIAKVADDEVVETGHYRKSQ